jgi:hypothetical protein
MKTFNEFLQDRQLDEAARPNRPSHDQFLKGGVIRQAKMVCPHCAEDYQVVGRAVRANTPKTCSHCGGEIPALGKYHMVSGHEVAHKMSAM